MTLPKPIDALAVARTTLADPRKQFTMSALEIMAICEALDRQDREVISMITDDLADSICEFLQVHQTMRDQGILAENGRFLVASNTAFSAFKTLFNMEFPDVGH